MEPARHAVPERPEMFGVAAADVLTTTQVLRRIERLEEIVVQQARKRSLVADGGFRHDAGFVNVVILERIVNQTVRAHVAVVVTARTAGASFFDLFGKDRFPARNECRLGRGRCLAREFSSVLRFTNSSLALSRSSSCACGNTTVRFSACTSSPLQDDAYEFMPLLRPSNHSGQLSEVSLFC